MSNEDVHGDHPFIESIKKYAVDGIENREELYQRAADQMLQYSPNDRVTLLNAMEKELDNDTSSARQHIQLEQLRRSMARQHEAMLRAKR